MGRISKVFIPNKTLYDFLEIPNTHTNTNYSSLVRLIVVTFSWSTRKIMTSGIPRGCVTRLAETPLREFSNLMDDVCLVSLISVIIDFMRVETSSIWDLSLHTRSSPQYFFGPQRCKTTIVAKDSPSEFSWYDPRSFEYASNVTLISHLAQGCFVQWKKWEIWCWCKKSEKI